MAVPLQTPKPLTRSESFQRMLDLEKRYKLARLHSSQTLPTVDTSLDLQSCAKKRSSAKPVLLSLRPGRASLPLQQTDSMPSLSITIPTPGAGESESRTPPNQEIAVQATAAVLDERSSVAEAPGSAHERPDGGDNDAASQYHEDDDQSDQSSICQSPSWEGYGQKKKKKKKQQEAENQKKENDRTEQARKAAANKRSSNRLFKAQPGESAKPSKHHKRSSGAHASDLLESSTTVATTAESTHPPSNQSHGLNIRSISENLGSHGSVSTAGLTVDRLPSSQGTTPSTESVYQGDGTLEGPRLSFEDKGKRKEDAAPLGNEKMSYPPPSSRSHILRSVVLPNHHRRNSASVVSSKSTSAFQGREPKTNEPSPVQSDSKLLASLTAEAAPRGRPSTSTSDREVDNYVHRARTQRVERSINGFMLEEALSHPGLTAQAEDSGLLYLNQLRRQPPLSFHHQRPAHARTSHPSDGIDGSSSSASTASEDNLPHLDLQLDKTNHSSREQKQRQRLETPKPSAESRDAEQPQAATRLSPSAKDNNIAPKATPTPSLSPAISATGTSGIFSSIKTRIGRRGSTSSGPSVANTGRSFKERAMGAMHLSSNTSAGFNGKSSTGKMAKNVSQTTVSSTSGRWSNATETSLPILSKPTRLLDDINTETMLQGKIKGGSRPSEGSSASSYHDGSSAPVSPASTPGTSRPQSIKGFDIGVGDTQHGDRGVPVSGQGTTTATLQPPATSKRNDTNQDKAVFVQPKHIRPQTSNTEDGIPAVSSHANKTMSHGEGPDSHDFTAQGIARATSSMSEQHSQAANGSGIGCINSEDLSKGLGISNESWAQSNAPSGGDTILTNMTPTVSGGSQQKASRAFDAKSSDGVGGKQDKNWSSSMSGNENAQQPVLKYQTVGAEAPEALDGCAEPARVHKMPAAAASAATASVVTLQSRSEASISSQQPEDHRSTTSKCTNTDTSASPKGAIGAGSDANATRPKAYATHGRGHSTSAIYLQDVRRSAPMISSPLSTVIRNTAKLGNRKGGSANSSTPSLSATGRALPSPSPTLSQFRLPEPAFGPQQPDAVRGSNASIGSSSLSSSSISLSSGSESRKKPPGVPVPRTYPPLAKMLVECCRCKFFHDMPSRVYECMAQPNAVVTDRDLGVSGAITTMVKCPWCSHNMTTRCCAGYAAVVYLKERLH